MWAKLGIVLVLIILLLAFAPSLIYVAVGGAAIVGGLAIGRASGLWSGGDDDFEIYDGGVGGDPRAMARQLALGMPQHQQQARVPVPGSPNFAANRAAIGAVLGPVHRAAVPAPVAAPVAAAAPAAGLPLAAAAPAPAVPPRMGPLPPPPPPPRGPAPLPPPAFGPAPLPPPAFGPAPLPPAPPAAAPAPALRDLTQERAQREAEDAMRIYSQSAYAIVV